jgi:RHS repeat-associated protein
LNVTVDPATNRITNSGMSYDANGSLTAMPGLNMTYDTDNRMLSNSSGDSYLYDASGQRVMKTNGSTLEYYFYGVEGNLLNNWPNGYNVYFGSKLIYNSGGTVVTDRLGSVVHKEQWTETRYFPYGDEPTTTQQNRPKFATYFRDSATALDYAQQRYYASTLGRFTSPDPYQASGGPADPQSWNRYAYVQNDPVNYDDPNGLYRCFVGYVPDWYEGRDSVCFGGGSSKFYYLQPDTSPVLDSSGGGSGPPPTRVATTRTRQEPARRDGSIPPAFGVPAWTPSSGMRGLMQRLSRAC